MELISPTEEYEASWHRAVGEFRNSGQATIKLWEVLGDPNDLEGCVRAAQNHARGVGLPPDWVPYNIYWLVDGGEIVGIVSIRRKLNDFLLREGGHIGYEIVPSKRKLGHGNKLLELVLEKAKGLGLEKVLITSLEDNIASQKIIEKCGGKIENKIEASDGLTRRYWIDL